MHKINKTISITETSNLKYDILMTTNLFDINNNTLYKYIKSRKLLVVISQTVNNLYYEKIYNYLLSKNDKENFNIISIPTGEQNKVMDNVLFILKMAKEFELDRKGLLVCIGGGILMDIVGFAASMYKRKIDYLRIPTTLIGQVDAGIGIKVGVNFHNSKNFIGSFYPPIACINDHDFLKTLPPKEIQNGLSEILKMAILADHKLFEIIENNSTNLISNKFQSDICMDINYRAISEMISELTPNFYESNLKRLVDFGHTFSPFIETYSSYKISHGFAVAMDIAISTEISFLLNKINLNDRNRILQLFLKSGLKIYDSTTFNSTLMWNSLNEIILHRGGDFNLVIPTKIGSATFIENISSISYDILDKALFNLKYYTINTEDYSCVLQ